jgi:hypothetical protein
MSVKYYQPVSILWLVIFDVLFHTILFVFSN